MGKIRSMPKNPFKTSCKITFTLDDVIDSIAQAHETNRLLQEQKFEQVVENLEKLIYESSDDEVLEELAAELDREVEHIEEQPEMTELEILEAMLAEVEEGNKK